MWLRCQEEPGHCQSTGWEAACHTGLGPRPARPPPRRSPNPTLLPLPECSAFKGHEPGNKVSEVTQERRWGAAVWRALPGTLCVRADSVHWLSQNDEAGEASRPQATAKGWSCWSLQAHEHGTCPHALCPSTTCLSGLLLVAECPLAPPALSPLGEDAGPDGGQTTAPSVFLSVLLSILLPRVTQVGFVLKLVGEQRPAPQTLLPRKPLAGGSRGTGLATRSTEAGTFQSRLHAGSPGR